MFSLRQRRARRVRPQDRGFERRSRVSNRSTAPRFAQSMESLKFSNHAVERMQSRGLSFDPAQMEKIEQAVQKAAAKGSKNSLLLMDDSALIVSVKDSHGRNGARPRQHERQCFYEQVASAP